MPQLINRLDVLKIKRAQKSGYSADGAGLYLQVSLSGARSWIYRFTLGGRTRDMGLAPPPYDLSESAQLPQVIPKVGVVPILSQKSPASAVWSADFGI